jgi:hypothetical protein
MGTFLAAESGENTMQPCAVVVFGEKVCPTFRSSTLYEDDDRQIPLHAHPIQTLTFDVVSHSHSHDDSSDDDKMRIACFINTIRNEIYP